MPTRCWPGRRKGPARSPEVRTGPVAGPVADSIAQIQLETGMPIGFAVLTVENVEQAVERSGPGAGNKGEEAAIGAIEMANVLKALR